MSATLSPDLRRLPSIVEQEFRAALLDDIAPAVARHWKGEIRELDVIDTGNYLEAVGVEGSESSGDVFTVTVGAERADSYAGAIRRGRGGSYDYVGQRAAEQGAEKSDADIRAGLDSAGKRITG